MDLRNRVVFVTGDAGGLGQQFVTQALALCSPKVYATPRRDHPWADARIVPVRLDVTDQAEIAAAAAAAQDTDVLINKAGGGGGAALLTSPEKEIRATFEANVFGPLLLVRAF